MPEPTIRYYLFHKNCPVRWQAGPFTTAQIAMDWAVAKLADKHSCPGCDAPTPSPLDSYEPTPIPLPE